MLGDSSLNNSGTHSNNGSSHLKQQLLLQPEQHPPQQQSEIVESLDDAPVLEDTGALAVAPAKRKAQEVIELQDSSSSSSSNDNDAALPGHAAKRAKLMQDDENHQRNNNNSSHHQQQQDPPAQSDMKIMLAAAGALPTPTDHLHASKGKEPAMSTHNKRRDPPPSLQTNLHHVPRENAPTPRNNHYNDSPRDTGGSGSSPTAVAVKRDPPAATTTTSSTTRLNNNDEIFAAVNVTQPSEEPPRKLTRSSSRNSNTSISNDANITDANNTKHNDNNQKPPKDWAMGKPEVVSSLLDLPPLKKSATLKRLSADELQELEQALEISADDGWRDDWSGNLAFTDKEVVNPRNAAKKGSNANDSFRQSLFLWAQKGDSPAALKNLHNLFRYVYHLKGTPDRAKTILANADKQDGFSLERAFRRVSYDPDVLRQDGWTTAKTKEPTGATGGANRIGERVRWQGSDGVVIAYVHDHDLGDLWRGLWVEEGLESFDMEAEELVDARKKWLRRNEAKASSGGGASKSQKQKDGKGKKGAKVERRSHRYNAANDFRVAGVEYGIVMAASYSRGARPGVYWPARVMHASEAALSVVAGAKGKRSAPRQRLDLVFLAPYWNSHHNPVLATTGNGNRRATGSFAESLSRHGESLFSSGPLFDVESVDVSEESIKEYLYDGTDGFFNLDQLRMAFRFTGLPKAAFSRFLDSHRLALGLRTFAQQNLAPTTTSSHASAGLFETHPMSVTAPVFPPEVLHLPYDYIISQLPPPPIEQITSDGQQKHLEPVLQLNTMIDSLKPPSCWGQARAAKLGALAKTPVKKTPVEVAESPFIDATVLLRKETIGEGPGVNIDIFIEDLDSLRAILEGNTSSPVVMSQLQSLQTLLSSISVSEAGVSLDERRATAKAHANLWMFTKTRGEDAIGIAFVSKNDMILMEWRRACERIYKYITYATSAPGFGNGVSVVLTDYKCNQHITSSGCFERPVRLPAALRVLRDMGAGTKENFRLVTSIEQSYIDKVEEKVLMKAHSAAYLRRMKLRCSQIHEHEVVYLTEDSDGCGGEDTKGSQGTWAAAIAAVGAAVKAVDMVVSGECVNAFCATRPPGHHAGRDLHSMKAVSNGFCILNTVACAALHATTPLSEGGPGLRRVCIIDFDVHHGNGTQDVLCSTFDPRFLYVSLHAGGSHVNGMPSADDFGTDIHSPGGTSQKKGIYPGKCGDSSPHIGVLNIPLGAQVTSHAVGTALISQVTPAVEAFCPDLIILSAGFDAHRNDPLGLGGLSSDDFAHITEVTCQMAFKCCSGRLVSVMEGGYGVPCCRPQREDIFLPPPKTSSGTMHSTTAAPQPSPPPARDAMEKPSSVAQERIVAPATEQSGATRDAVSAPTVAGATAASSSAVATDPPKNQRPQPLKLLILGEELPAEMDDQVPYALQRRLEKCHQEGFMDCVREHVNSLTKCNNRG